MPVSRTRVNPQDPSPAGTTGRRYAGVDPQERQRQRKVKLIKAALVVFGEQGYHQSTVRDVCKQAQLTSRYFYESFDSMEALFRAVYSDVSRQLLQVTVAALSQCPPTPTAMAEVALRAFLEFIRADPRRARLTLLDALNVGEGMNSLANKASQDFAQLVGGFMQQFFPNLGAIGLSAHTLADGLVGACNRIATQWAAEQCQTPIEDVLRNILALFKACIEFAERNSPAAPPASGG